MQKPDDVSDRAWLIAQKYCDSGRIPVRYDQWVARAVDEALKEKDVSEETKK